MNILSGGMLLCLGRNMRQTLPMCLKVVDGLPPPHEPVQLLRLAGEAVEERLLQL